MNKLSRSADETVINGEGRDAVCGEREDEARADHGVACLLHQEHPVVLLRLLHRQLGCFDHIICGRGYGDEDVRQEMMNVEC